MELLFRVDPYSFVLKIRCILGFVLYREDRNLLNEVDQKIFQLRFYFNSSEKEKGMDFNSLHETIIQEI